MKNLVTLMVTLAAILFSTVVQAEQTQHIRRAVITTAIDQREPVDNLTNTVVTSVDKVYLFTEVVNKPNEFITHRWFLNGKLEAEVTLKIGSSRWRTYSSKNLVSIHKGNWQVDVVDQQNKVLASAKFSYQ